MKAFDQLYMYCPGDDTWAKQNKKGAYSHIKKEHINKKHWEKILALTVMGETPSWVYGFGKMEVVTSVPIRTYFYVDI